MFYQARPANSGTSVDTRSGATIFYDLLTFEEAEDLAAPYVADLRCFGRIAVGLPPEDNNNGPARSSPGEASPGRSADPANAGGLDG
ncbi:MAG TPA: hypothetical protein VF680_11525 [Allosphingosinicella sp.]|jgi:hypothetical protein